VLATILCYLTKGKSAYRYAQKLAMLTKCDRCTCLLSPPSFAYFFHKVWSDAPKTVDTVGLSLSAGHSLQYLFALDSFAAGLRLLATISGLNLKEATCRAVIVFFSFCANLFRLETEQQDSSFHTLHLMTLSVVWMYCDHAPLDTIHRCEEERPPTR
jgi:hypothetical protein